MKFRRTFATLLSVLASVALGQSPQAGAIGLAEIEVLDSARHRPLHTYVWYPAEANTGSCTRALDGIFVSRSCQNADLRKDSTRMPLILLSHGTGGTGSSLVWLGEFLAEHGYLVASVEHYGNTYRNDSPDGKVAVWRRPRDLSRVLDALLADPRFGSRIAKERIGAAGFSAGGYTVLALAGGIYQPQRMKTYCTENPGESDCKYGGDVDLSHIADLADASRSFHDARFRAVFALAPAVGQGFEPSSLGKIDIPVGITAGIHDEIVPFRLNAESLSKRIPKARLFSLASGGHFVFISRCNSMGLAVAPDICKDADPSTDRQAVHAKVQEDALSFFGSNL